MKWHQVLTAYACDTAQTEVTGKGAEKYLQEHNIVDSDVERISEQLLLRNVREQRLKHLLIEFHIKGMEKIINGIENKEEIPPFEELYQIYKSEIENLL